MKTFSIRELENFSGIKAHTLRSWEQRFHIFQPERHNGIRRYGFPDVRKLLDISLLLQNGLKISQLAKLDAHTLREKTANLLTETSIVNKAIYRLITAMIEKDIEAFENMLDSCVLEWGIDTTIGQVIIPFLERTSIVSYIDSSAEVHLVVTAVRKKLILGIETVGSEITSRSALLFLAEGEHYDLILLYIAYILKRSGIRVLYLGTNISTAALKQMITDKKPDYLYTYLPPKEGVDIECYTRLLEDAAPKSRLFIVSSEMTNFPTVSGAKVTFIYYKDTIERLPK